MHKSNGINTLYLLQSVKSENYNYDIGDLKLKLFKEAQADYPQSSILQAMTQFKSKKNKRMKKWSKEDDYDDIKDEVETELDSINKIIQILQAKQNIINITNNWIPKSWNKYKFSLSTSEELTDLVQCLNEYQKPKIFDETCYAYPCPHCKSGSNSKWTKITKTIVYSPPVFLFHLDRYGKNMTSSTVKSRPSSNSNSYYVGQELMVNYGGKAYKTRILNVNSHSMRVQYLCDNQTEEIMQSNYGKRLPSYKGKNYGSNNYQRSRYGSNKFDHEIGYKLKLEWKNMSSDINDYQLYGVSNHTEYDLYGVSNHSGTTMGGHYTATIKCLTDRKWYDISDSHVTSGNINPLSSSRSATILAYARKQS
eukprot:855255_1